MRRICTRGMAEMSEGTSWRRRTYRVPIDDGPVQDKVGLVVDFDDCVPCGIDVC